MVLREVLRALPGDEQRLAQGLDLGQLEVERGRELAARCRRRPAAAPQPPGSPRRRGRRRPTRPAACATSPRSALVPGGRRGSVRAAPRRGRGRSRARSARGRHVWPRQSADRGPRSAPPGPGIDRACCRNPWPPVLQERCQGRRPCRACAGFPRAGATVFVLPEGANGHRLGTVAGSTTAKVVSTPGSLARVIVPPMRSTASLQNGRPSPVSLGARSATGRDAAELLEDAAPGPRADAPPVVDDPQRHGASGARRRAMRTSGLPLWRSAFATRLTSTRLRSARSPTAGGTGRSGTSTRRRPACSATGAYSRVDLVDDLRQHDPLPRDRHLALLDLGDLEEVLDQAHHLAAGALDLAQIAAVRLGQVGALAQRQLHHHRDAVHRVLQVVDDHARQVVLQPLDLRLRRSASSAISAACSSSRRRLAVDEAAVDVGVDRERHVEEDRLDERLGRRAGCARRRRVVGDERAECEAQVEREGADVPLRAQPDALVRVADAEPALEVAGVEPPVRQLRGSTRVCRLCSLRDAPRLGAQQRASSSGSGAGARRSRRRSRSTVGSASVPVARRWASSSRRRARRSASRSRALRVDRGREPLARSGLAAPAGSLERRSRAHSSCGRATTARGRAAPPPSACRGRCAAGPSRCGCARRRAARRADRRRPAASGSSLVAQRARQVRDRDPLAVAEDHRVLDDVVELAHVALPRLRHEQLQRRVVDAAVGALHLAVVPPDEELDQARECPRAARAAAAAGC